jgi:hypothetical protein
MGGSLEDRVGSTTAFYPVPWVRFSAVASLLLLGAGTLGLCSCEYALGALLLGGGVLALTLFLLEWCRYDVTDSGVQVTRISGSKTYLFSRMRRVLGGQVQRFPSVAGIAGSGTVNSHSVVDRDGRLLFRIGLTTARREELVRIIRMRVREVSSETI